MRTDGECGDWARVDMRRSFPAHKILSRAVVGDFFLYLSFSLCLGFFDPFHGVPAFRVGAARFAFCVPVQIPRCYCPPFFLWFLCCWVGGLATEGRAIFCA